MLKLYRKGRVGFIVWLDRLIKCFAGFPQLLLLVVSDEQNVEILIATESVGENLSEAFLQGVVFAKPGTNAKAD